MASRTVECDSDEPEYLNTEPDYSDIGIMTQVPSKWWQRGNTYNVVWETGVRWVPRDSVPYPPPPEECGQIRRRDGTTSYLAVKLTPRESTMTIPSNMALPGNGMAIEIFKRHYPWNPADRECRCTDIYMLKRDRSKPSMVSNP